jgi:inosose dehydratase
MNGRSATRRPLAGTTLGLNQLLWANDDVPDLTPSIDPLTILDEIARLGFAGSQLGSTFPRGEALRSALRRRGLRIAEVYACLPCTPDGPTIDARTAGIDKLRELHDAEGDVFVAALPLAADRVEHAGRASTPGVPRLTDAGLDRVAGLLEDLANEAREIGHPLAFHPHVGTYVETADETERLMAATDPDLVGLCLDVGHWRLAGGDPVEAIDRYGARIRHVHLKDVDVAVAARLRTGEIPDFVAALRERIFTELGRGELDLPGVIDALDRHEYRGWLIVEHDTSWRPAAESAAISRAIVEFVLRELPRIELVA